MYAIDKITIFRIGEVNFTHLSIHVFIAERWHCPCGKCDYYHKPAVRRWVIVHVLFGWINASKSDASVFIRQDSLVDDNSDTFKEGELLRIKP